MCTLSKGLNLGFPRMVPRALKRADRPLVLLDRGQDDAPIREHREAIIAVGVALLLVLVCAIVLAYRCRQKCCCTRAHRGSKHHQRRSSGTFRPLFKCRYPEGTSGYLDSCAGASPTELPIYNASIKETVGLYNPSVKDAASRVPTTIRHPMPGDDAYDLLGQGLSHGTTACGPVSTRSVAARSHARSHARSQTHGDRDAGIGRVSQLVAARL